MASEDILKVLRGAIIKNDKDAVGKILNDHADIDLVTKNVDEDSLISVAIESADVQMLALLLGVQSPPYECANAASESKYDLVNGVSSSENYTPLMNAVQHGKVEMVSLLLHSGAEVNYFSPNGKAAIDLSTDPKILLALFKGDSKFPIDEKKSKELQKLISEDKDLSKFFKKRDEVHKLIKMGVTKSFNSYLKKDNMRRKYCVNSLGDSLLYTALTNKNPEVWADLLVQRMEYATLKEKEEERDIKALREEMWERVLPKLLIPVTDCHLMKLVSKSYKMWSDSHGKKTDGIILKCFKYLNDIEITKTLLLVLQDVPGLQIAFDFDHPHVERMRACCSKGGRGITDFDRCKICVAALESEHFSFPDIVSNLAHELCHLALEVVYKNNGLPYKKDDVNRERLYKEVMENIIGSQGCNRIISKVWDNYIKSQHGRELIVRIPEMVALYSKSEPDFSKLLNEQEKALETFFVQYVLQDLKNYVEGSFTSNRIIGRGLMEYQKLLSLVDRIQINSNINKDVSTFIARHNYLKVLRTSNVELARNHLKLSWEKKGKVAPFFVNWSLYKQWSEFFRKSLMSREIEMLAISWDINDAPRFCKHSDCRDNECPGYDFREFENCIYILVSTKWNVMKNIESYNYSWGDLSPETKTMIQEREVEFGGQFVKLKTLLSSSEGGDYFDEFVWETLDSTDISFLLEGWNIIIDEGNSLLDGQGNDITLKHSGSFVSQKLAQKFVKLDGHMFRKFENDVFFVSNIGISDLCNYGISERDIRQWNVGTCNSTARCYVMHPYSDDKREQSVFLEIMKQYRGVGDGQKLHHLKFRGGMFAHIRSVNIPGIQTLNYSWNDLSLETKMIIQERVVEFGGKFVKLKNLISSAEGADYFEVFMRECLDSKDINLLLEGKNIKLGETNSLLDGLVEDDVLKHPGIFIPREITQNIVLFNGDMLRRFKKDVFLVSNIGISDLCHLGISESDIRQWNVSNCNGTARCYVLHPLSDGKDEQSVLLKVVEHHRDVGCCEKLHHLKFRQGMFAHIKSLNIQNETDCYLAKVQGLISQTDKRQLGALDFKSPDPLLVADNPGTGKTTFLYFIAKKIKESHPEQWISIVDLSVPTLQKHLMAMAGKRTSSEKETLDLLFLMVGSGRENSMERKIFDEFCRKKNKIMVFFDAFDETCPDYKSFITSFIVALRKISGNIKLVVSTRLHERFDLEEALGIISFQLIPFSEDDQMTFMNEYWNELLRRLSLSLWQKKMKCFIDCFERWIKEEHDNGITDLICEMRKMLKKGKLMKKDEYKLNFIPIVRKVLFGQKPLLSDLDKFTETPLHIQMVAALIFEDSFKMNRILNLGHLYQLFFNLKMKIFVLEKAGGSGNVMSERLTKIANRAVTKELEALSANFLQVGNSFEVMVDEIRDACDIGLMTLKGEDYQFIHRTFAEFFFARRLLRKAGRSDVAKLWLERLYVDDQFERVRVFIEDILYLLSEGWVDSERAEDFLMLWKTNLNQSVLNNPSGLTTSIYSIVLDGSGCTLQYFADSFGENVADVLIQDFESADRSAVLSDINTTVVSRSRNVCKCGINSNAFTFAASCFAKFSKRVVKMMPYVMFLRKMLDLVKKYQKLNEIKQLLVTTEALGLLPTYSAHHKSIKDHLMYCQEVFSFLVENKEIFGDILMRWMISTSDSSTQLFFRGIFTLNFDLVPLVVGALYDETQLKTMLAKKGIIFKVWTNTTGKCGLHGTLQVWNFIKEGLGRDVNLLQNYLMWKDTKKFNALARSAYNDDPEVIEFIWELAGELMNVNEKKKWLFDSFGCEVWLISHTKYLGWSFHKFLARLVNGGFLSGDEMFHLLKSQDYILQGYPYGFFTHVLPINHGVLRESVKEKLCNVNLFDHLYCWLEHNSSLPLNEDLKDEVDKIFEEVRSLDNYGLADQLEVDETGFLVGVKSWKGKIHPERLKFFVVTFFKQVMFCKAYFGKDGLVTGLQVPNESRTRPNILHLVVNSMSSLCLGYVTSVLIGSFSRSDFLGLLLEPDSHGDNVFHVTVTDHLSTMWDKLDCMIRAIFDENAVTVIYSIPNNVGLCVNDTTLEKKVQLGNIFLQKTNGEEDEKPLAIMSLLFQENANIDDEEGPLVRSIKWVWINTVGKCRLTRLRQVWNIIKGSLRDNPIRLLNFLLWKNKNNCNVLIHSAYNEDPEVLKFIWELAGELMNDNEKKKWLFDSFGCKVQTRFLTKYLGWSFHKFLGRLVNGGFLSGSEMFHLLKSQDYILRGYPYGFFTYMLPINHFITMESFKDEMHSVHFFYDLDCWLEHNSSLPLNEELKDEVDKIFEEVRSLDSYGLADQLEVDETGFLVGVKSQQEKVHADRFKFFVVAFFKQVQFCRDHFEEDGLIRCLKVPEELRKSENVPNILHVVVDSISSLCLGYVSSMLIASLSRGHFLGLLLEPDNHGNNLFHVMIGDCSSTMWNKLNSMVRAIFDEKAVRAIYSIPNDEGSCIKDEFPDKEQSETKFSLRTYGEEDENPLAIMSLLFQENANIDDEERPLVRLIKWVWINTVGNCQLTRIRQVWNIIRGSLRDNPTQLLNFLLWKNKNNCNVLVHSAYNEDLEVINFIWELAGELMNDNKKKKWLFDSFSCEVWLISHTKYLGWSFHKFLARLVNGGFLSGDEMFHLLKSQDYILQGYPYGFFTHVLPINHGVLRESVKEKLCNVNLFDHLYCWLEHNSSFPLNEDLKDEVDKIFEEVRSHDSYGLADQLEVDETGFLVGVKSWKGKIHPDRLKFFVVTFFKQVMFCKTYFGEDGLFKLFRWPVGFIVCKVVPNGQNLKLVKEAHKPEMTSVILNMFSCLAPALCLGYVSSILLDCLPQHDFLDLLFISNRKGCTVFHNAINNYDSDAWEKLNVIVGSLLGKEAVSANPTKKLFRMDRLALNVALEERLVRWKRILTSQKEQQRLEDTLHQITDEDELNEMDEQEEVKL